MGLVELDKLLKDIKKNLEDIYGGRLKKVILFGSYARKEATPLSDIDFLIVLDTFKSVGLEIERMNTFGSALSLKYDITISLIPVCEADYENRKSPFLINVSKEGIAV